MIITLSVVLHQVMTKQVYMLRLAVKDIFYRKLLKNIRRNGNDKPNALKTRVLSSLEKVLLMRA